MDKNLKFLVYFGFNFPSQCGS